MFLVMGTAVTLLILTQEDLTRRQGTGRGTEDQDRSSRCPAPGDTHKMSGQGRWILCLFGFFPLAAAVRAEGLWGQLVRKT